MIAKEDVIKLVEDYLTETNYYLVDVKVTRDNQICVEVDSFDGVSIDFCVELNRHIESKLDRDVEDYELQVSSAGLTEPFKVLKQYEKNIGNEVEVITKDHKKLTGMLEGLKDTGIILQIEKQVKPEGAKRKITVTENMHIHFENIKTTKYNIRFK
ncbi:MAG: ribosome assembly cofactor RimP [Paludibacteraceae bacterium]